MKIIYVGYFSGTAYANETPDEVLVFNQLKKNNKIAAIAIKKIIGARYFSDTTYANEVPNKLLILNQLEKNNKIITVPVEKVFDIIKIENPDVVLFSPLGNINIDRFSLLISKLKAKKVMWTFDWAFHSNRDKWFIPQAKLMDLLVTTESTINWSKYGINQVCIRQGCDKSLHKRVCEDKEYLNDVVFVGNMYQEERKKYLQKIAQYYDLKIYGTIKMSGVPQGRAVFNDELCKVYSSCKIALGDKYPGVDEGYWSNRVYLALGCGAFFLTPYIRGLEEEFKNKKHLVWFHNIDEAISLIDYYLHHPKERKEIADAGYELVHKKYSYEQRVKKLIKEINKIEIRDNFLHK